MSDKPENASFEIANLASLTAGNLMEKKVQAEKKDAKAEMLATEMMEGFGSVPIIDQDNRLVGIVSEFDLLKAVRKGKSLRDITAGDIMTPSPVSVTEHTDVVTVMDVLQNNHLIRVPVVDSTGKLIGILATAGYTAWVSSICFLIGPPIPSRVRANRPPVTNTAHLLHSIV